MKGSERLVAAMFVMAIMLGGSGAYGAEPASEAAAENKWQFEVVPYLWMAGLSGDVGVKGSEAHVNVSFSDIVDKLEFGLQGYAEARKDKWGMFFDGTYLDLSHNGEVIRNPVFGPAEGKVSMAMWLVEFGGLYQVAKWPLEKEKAINLDMLGGGRYWALKTEFSLSQPQLGRSTNESASEYWIDPFAGLRLRVNLSESFLLAMRGDIGGFGVGSEFTWNASALLAYKITPTVSAWAGYRALYVNYVKGSGDDKVEFDVTMHGPMIGLGFYF